MNDSATSGHWPGDLLTRAELSGELRKVIATMRSGGVFGIDAPFGHGKSYFVAGLGAELRSDGYTVAYFDAWKADLAAHPLFLFVTDVLSQISEQGVGISERPQLGERVKRLTSAVARIGLKSVLRAGEEDIDKLVEPFIAEVDRLDFSKKGAAADALALASEIEAARGAFSDAVQALLVEPNKKLPLLIVIDELDRVRPDFAIEFLEALKFIFATEHVVFCVSVDRKNLAESLRARFGERYDVEQYLARLFSFWVRLANPVQNVNFMKSALVKRNLISDRLLVDGDAVDEGVDALAHLAVVGLGERSKNLRAMERSAERASVCVRALAPQKWAGLVGLLCGLSVADPDFLEEFVSPDHDIDDRDQGSPYVPPVEIHDDFLTRLHARSNSVLHEEWTAAVMLAWSLSESDVRTYRKAIAKVFDESTAEMAVAIAREISLKKHLHGQSAAEAVYAKVGWILG